MCPKCAGLITNVVAGQTAEPTLTCADYTKYTCPAGTALWVRISEENFIHWTTQKNENSQ